MSEPFNILAIVQQGRLAQEALLLAASLRASDPGFSGRLLFAEPEPGPLWPEDPRLPEGALRRRLIELGAEFVPFTPRHFGADYPNANKIEALAALPDQPFLFLDTDTLITGPISRLGFDFNRPSASMRRENTWPVIELYGPSLSETWGALYRRFGLDIEGSLDLSQPEDFWRRHLYFNAGWFFHASPRQFGELYLRIAREIRDDPPPELVCQQLYPWLDQIALPLVIHALGGGRPGPELAGMDGDVTCHYRTLPLLHARESDRAVQLFAELAAEPKNLRFLRNWNQARLMLAEDGAARARALFDRNDLPAREQAIRNRLRREGLWLR